MKSQETLVDVFLRMERLSWKEANSLETILDKLYSKMECMPSLLECNDIRAQNGQSNIAASTLSNAISKWNEDHPNVNKTLCTLVGEFHYEMGRLPSLQECNYNRAQNGQSSIAASTFRNTISKWNKDNPHANFGTAKTLRALIHEFHVKRGCLPTLAQCNDIRAQNGWRASAVSTYEKEVQKWNREHPSPCLESVEAVSEFNDEVSVNAVSTEVENLVYDLTHSAAQRGIRTEGYIKPINDAVKGRVQRDIDEYLESNSRKMRACACCDELCRPKDVHDVSLNKRWTDILCRRLRWTSDIPDAIRADYDVAKVDSCLQALGNIALSPRGVLKGKHGGNLLPNLVPKSTNFP